MSLKNDGDYFGALLTLFSDRIINQCQKRSTAVFAVIFPLINDKKKKYNRRTALRRF